MLPWLGESQFGQRVCSLSKMTIFEFERICHWLDAGGKMFVKRSIAGDIRIKIVHGPFGLRKHRYSATDESFRALKELLKSREIALA